MLKLKEYYIYIAIVLFAMGVFSYQYIKIIKLENEVANLTTDKVILQSNNIRLNESIKSQNEAIEKIEVDYNSNILKLRELENQPPKERFRVIYQTIPNLEAQSDECEDIKNLIDNIRNAGY